MSRLASRDSSSNARFRLVGLSALLMSVAMAGALVGCGDDEGDDSNGGGTGGSSSGTGGSKNGSGGGSNTGGGLGNGGDNTSYVPTDPTTGPAAGNPDDSKACPVPADAELEDVSNPDHVIGDGTPESCTSQAVVDTVALGGVITFDCGPDPITIELEETAKIVNDTGPKIVIDGGGKVTLSGKGERRILYQNTCDQAQKWTTPNCDNQDHPQLTVQNLTFVDGFHPGETQEDGGAAIFVRGGRFKLINSRFFNNKCEETGPDVGGAGLRVFDMYDDQPVYIVHSTFGGEDGYGNECSNGGAISSIGTSYTVINSLMSYNRAIGNGANPAQSGTPGGGSGGAIYNDGNTFTLTLCGTTIEHNDANEGGGAIFFVSNDRSGHLVIDRSVLTDNPSGEFETDGFPGIFVQAAEDPTVTDSVLE